MHPFITVHTNTLWCNFLFRDRKSPLFFVPEDDKDKVRHVNNRHLAAASFAMLGTSSVSKKLECFTTIYGDSFAREFPADDVEEASAGNR